MAARRRDNLPAMLEAKRREAARAVTRALIVGASHASLYTPVSTSNLLNSQYKRIMAEGSRIVGTVGYTADYAKYVHDPAVKHTFRRTTAKKEFLRLGFEDARTMIDKIITDAVRAK